MFHFNPYDPHTTMYATYTSTTTVPTYILRQNLMSLADQESRLHAQREQLEEEERRIRGLRAATLRRIRAQQLREAIEEAEIQDIIEEILEKERIGERVMRDAVMYLPFVTLLSRKMADQGAREILSENEQQSAQGLSEGRGLPRLLKIRELLDPSPHRRPTRRHQYRPAYRMPDEPPEGTPVVDELPKHYHRTFSQYVPEQQTYVNKRGSRRNSSRRESFVATESSLPVPPTSTSETLRSFGNLRLKLQAELTSIPPSIRSDTSPTAEEQKVLQHHIAKLEDLLDEVDAVVLPVESVEDVVVTRKARREIVTDIVAVIDGIEKHLRPNTPDTASVVGADNASGEEQEHELLEDSDENALIDMEIQRVIRETLSRKRDEENTSRRSVTVEDVPDPQY